MAKELEKEIEELTAALKKSDTERNELQDEVDKLKDKLSDLENKLDDVEGELENYKGINSTGVRSYINELEKDLYFRLNPTQRTVKSITDDLIRLVKE